MGRGKVGQYALEVAPCPGHERPFEPLRELVVVETALAQVPAELGDRLIPVRVRDALPSCPVRVVSHGASLADPRAHHELPAQGRRADVRGDSRLGSRGNLPRRPKARRLEKGEVAVCRAHGS